MAVISSCGNKTYENLTARYNGWYYADLRLSEVFQEVENSYQYNYNDVLKIYADVDSGVVDSNEAKLEDAFKKASQVIDWHKNSDWVDDSYLIVGKIRYLKGQFPFAIETLQYINQKSDDDDVKHAALIALMRTYMDMGENESALQTANYLEAADLSAKNLADYRMTRALYHQRAGELVAVAQNLNEAVDRIDDRYQRSKVNFILGQIYQKLDYDTEAYDFYKKSLAGNPPYELTFYANLNMLQVAPVNNEGIAEDLRKSYAKLLKDGKNAEYLGKIYYEMGEFEKKQNNFNRALDNYLTAVSVQNPSPRQKALSYLRAGELYYDHYENFENASVYYDSTISILPQDEANYDQIKKRQTILADFVTQLNIIQKNDSLLALSEMNPVSLDAYLDEYLQKKAEKEREELRAQNQSVNSGVNQIDRSGSTAGSPTTGTWYFYNTSAVDQGALAFQRTWGNRPLEDDWRRSNKDANFSDEPESDLPDDATDPNVISADVNEPTDVGLEQEKAELLATIPSTPEAKEAARIEVEEAYYKLGGIYQFGLEKVSKAAGTYVTLISKYPATALKPEALYALYLIFKDTDQARAEGYKNQIISEFPETLIAKTLINPNYLEDKEARDQELQRIYAKAYYANERGEYQLADQILRDALATYKDVYFLPQVKLLSAIVKAKTENLFSYEKALKEFIKEYPEGPQHEYAQELLAGINPRKKDIIRSDEFEFSEDFKQLHIISILLSADRNKLDSLKNEINTYNKRNFSDLTLVLGELDFDEGKDQKVVIINSFSTKEDAQAYNKVLSRSIRRFRSLRGVKFDNFVISRDNFQMLFQSKKVEDYLNFYRRFYQ